MLVIRGATALVVIGLVIGAWQVAYARGKDEGRAEGTAIRTEFIQARQPGGAGTEAAGAATKNPKAFRRVNRSRIIFQSFKAQLDGWSRAHRANAMHAASRSLAINAATLEQQAAKQPRRSWLLPRRSSSF